MLQVVDDSLRDILKGVWTTEKCILPNSHSTGQGEKYVPMVMQCMRPKSSVGQSQSVLQKEDCQQQSLHIDAVVQTSYEEEYSKTQVHSRKLDETPD